MRKFVIVILCSILFACNKEDNTANNFVWPPVSINAEPDSFGLIVDSEIEGLRYLSGDHYGLTGVDGQFGYIQGETIQFYIGGVKIGNSITPAKLLTPYELASGDPDIALNIARFLQTLDDDANPDNGIKINPSAHILAGIQNLVFSGAEWESNDTNTIINNLVYEITSENLAGPKYLITEYDAYIHLTNTLNNLIDGLVDDMVDVANDSSCNFDNQCTINSLEPKYPGLILCPDELPHIAHSNINFDLDRFSNLAMERVALINTRESLTAAGANFCIITALRPICNSSGHCEIENYTLHY